MAVLWKSDGRRAGTVLVEDIKPGPDGSGTSFLTVVDGTLFFTLTTAPTGQKGWKSNGAKAGTVMVRDIRAGDYSSGPSFPEAAGEHSSSPHEMARTARAGSRTAAETAPSWSGTSIRVPASTADPPH